MKKKLIKCTKGGANLSPFYNNLEKNLNTKQKSKILTLQKKLTGEILIAYNQGGKGFGT